MTNAKNALKAIARYTKPLKRAVPVHGIEIRTRGPFLVKDLKQVRGLEHDSPLQRTA